MATKLKKGNKVVMADTEKEVKFYKKLGYKVPVKPKHVEKSMMRVKKEKKV